MRMKFIDISGKIDAVTIDAIAVIKRVAEAIGVPFFLVGATAKDFLLEYSQTVLLRRNPRLEINVATLAGLAMMKLISWKDNYPNRSKDASDLKTIIYSYTDAGNVERVYNELLEFVDSDKYDYFAAGAILLGQDMAKMMSEESKSIVLGILENETKAGGTSRLIEDMVKTGSLRAADFEYTKGLLVYLKQGIGKGTQGEN